MFSFAAVNPPGLSVRGRPRRPAADSGAQARRLRRTQASGRVVGATLAAGCGTALLVQRRKRVQLSQLGFDYPVAKERQRLKRLFNIVARAVEDQDGARAAGRIGLEQEPAGKKFAKRDHLVGGTWRDLLLRVDSPARATDHEDLHGANLARPADADPHAQRVS